ncbi:lysine/arginine/ornithine ABC transporter substrate-binding protein [Pasteurella atlantica]|uniref:lysine/arginine/ornithine ABC transporter substrate-binding protein n=1 Tax=Pasteurellaceae TaxID=712 RepID=UPI00276F0B6C|nr:lysine/arginine/ornithine ABC transporter substrate-binding protein [Pasteurella atlantica]MDP8033220.1 lysine/arginine/ornithine ABC transporter substrate-binding protein [Pasteurella atlantica]MDP8035230.1 lysine/arginine/ornithine ABC transporter substrate-binding protein [Pasteurella atlantica]MDP8037180.1 lysine/arginine/ornithine ABC transporter substrate-binding protein [Pasteurella atlantica]MDP8047367.1 lysine/arginine/ornithine ABC transporter substrate-binding protein [Pasteurella
MKKLLLTALFATTALSVAAKDTITFAMEPTYAPFESTTEKGEIVGFDVDLAKALCTELEMTCQFKNTPFDSLIPSLKFKKFDAIISAMDVTEKRQKQVSFTEPYLENSASFLALKEKKTPETAKIVGVQNGTTYQEYLVKKAPQYQTKAYASLQSAILDLKNGRIDMIFGDTPVLAEWLPTETSVTFVGDKVKDKDFFGVGYGIAVNKSNKELLEKLNTALKTVKENGTLDKIYQTWMTKK